MICEYCGEEHDGNYKSGRFCSKKCASGFSTKAKRQEINEKVSKTLIIRSLLEHGEIVTEQKILDIQKNKLEKKKNFNKENYKEVYKEKYDYCLICGIKIDGSYREGRYCSRDCSRKAGGKIRSKRKPFGGHTSKLRIDYKMKNGEIVHLQSSYEVSVAKSLDENNINWIRPKPFKWKDSQGIEHRYYPDFYLIDYNIYLDPKNSYLIIKDKEKIELVSKQNNICIIILDGNNLDWEKIKNKM
jgi:hypothetical protein